MLKLIQIEVFPTKSYITSINSQMDTAIQGKVRKSLETKIPNMLLKYDEI